MKIRTLPLIETKSNVAQDKTFYRQRDSLVLITTPTMIPSKTWDRYPTANFSMQESLLMEEILIKTIS